MLSTDVTPPPTPAVLAARQILDALHPDRETTPAPDAQTIAQDVSLTQAQTLFPRATKDRKAPLPVSPLAGFAAVEQAYDSLAVPRRAPEARATAIAEARARILRSLDRSTPISAAELDRRAAEQVDGVHWGATADRLAQALPALEVAVDTLAAAVERSHVARRIPQDPDAVGDTGLTPAEQAILAQPSAFSDERALYGATLVEQREIRRGQQAIVQALAEVRAVLAIDASTDVEDLLQIAAHGTPAEQRRADWVLSRRQVRVDTNDPVGALREHQSIQARHAAIRDGRVPASIRAAEAAERAYLDELRERVRFRAATARIIIKERGDLEGLFVTPTQEAAQTASLREAAVQAWAPIVARARATT